MSKQISLFKTLEGKEKFLKSYNQLMETWTIPYEDKWVDTSFGKTHVVISGPVDGEPLVLLPGAQATCGLWGPMIPALTQKRRVFCIDIIDQVGLSEVKKVLTSPEDSSSWLKETLDALKLDRIELGGNSLGAFIASMFAVNHPQMVKKLILTAPAAGISGISLSYVINANVANISSKLSAKVKFLDKAAAGLVDEKSKQFQVQLTAMTQSNIISRIIPRALTKTELEKLEAPALLILGEKDISSSKPAHKVVEKISKMELDFHCEILKDAGHLWTEQDLITAGDLIVNFLNSSK